MTDSIVWNFILLLNVRFPKSPQGIPLDVFLPLTFTATFVLPEQLQLLFSDTLTYLLTYCNHVETAEFAEALLLEHFDQELIFYRKLILLLLFLFGGRPLQKV